MSLLPSQEQIDLEQSLRDFFSREVSSEYLRKRIAAQIVSDPALWKSLSELGLLAYFSSQEADSRPGIRELGIVVRESGHALLPEPLNEVLLAGPWLHFQFLDEAARGLIAKHFGSSFGKSLEEGSKSVGLASNSFSRPVSVAARNVGPLVRVTAKLPLVPFAQFSNYLLFCGSTAENAAPTLYLADLGSGKEQRVTSVKSASLDLTRAYYDVQLENVAALDLGAAHAQRLSLVLSAMIAEELAGICGRVVTLTLDYVKTRKQFGVAIGTFQAVQHRLADMYLQTEALRSIASFASWSSQESKEQAELASRAALAFACEQAPQIIEAAIQMHGGIGFTWEYELHLSLRRAKMLEMLFGSSAAGHRALIQAAR